MVGQARGGQRQLSTVGAQGRGAVGRPRTPKGPSTPLRCGRVGCPRRARSLQRVRVRAVQALRDALRSASNATRKGSTPACEPSRGGASHGKRDCRVHERSKARCGLQDFSPRPTLNFCSRYGGLTNLLTEGVTYEVSFATPACWDSKAHSTPSSVSLFAGVLK